MTVDSAGVNAAVFHSRFLLSTSEECDLLLPPLANDQIKLAMAGNLISISAVAAVVYFRALKFLTKISIDEVSRSLDIS